jgi:hypothetical protein
MKFEHRNSLIAALALVIANLVSPVARAVPPEYMRSIALHPSDPQLFVLRYESAFGGLWFSRDGGQSLQMVPGQSFYKYDLRRFVPMQLTGEGKFLLALDNGLRVDDGKGCGLEKEEPALAGLWVADLAAHPSEPDTTFLITTGDTKGKHAGIWRRKQGVVTSLGTSEPPAAMPNRPSFIATGLRAVVRAASSEGVRLIVAGVSYDYSTTTSVSTPVLRVSDNLGMSWTTHPIPDKTGGNPRILHVDGSDPFKALLYIENGFGEDASDAIDPIFITKDGGAMITPYLDKVQVAGEIVVLPSGQVLIGDRGVPGGLWSAANLDAAPSKIADYSVHCLAFQKQTQKLFMCKLNELGFYDVASNTFCSIFRPSDTASLVSCPSAPLTENKDVARQLCGGFCGAAHYASAPVCSTFMPPPTTNLCGPSAVAFDNDDPDPEKRWIEPPGASGAPRCTGFTGPTPVDAGTGTLVDAGAGAVDGGAPTGDDAGSELDAGDEQDAAAPAGERGEDAAKKGGGGCQLGLAGDASARHVALFGALALLLGLAVRRQRRAR